MTFTSKQQSLSSHSFWTRKNHLYQPPLTLIILYLTLPWVVRPNMAVFHSFFLLNISPWTSTIRTTTHIKYAAAAAVDTAAAAAAIFALCECLMVLLTRSALFSSIIRSIPVSALTVFRPYLRAPHPFLP